MLAFSEVNISVEKRQDSAQPKHEKRPAVDAGLFRFWVS